MNKLKRIYPILLLVIYVTSCSYGKIRFGQKQKFDRDDHAQIEDSHGINQPKSIESIPSNSFFIDTSHNAIDENIQSVRESKVPEKSIEERVKSFMPNNEIPQPIQKTISSIDRISKAEVLKEKDEAAVNFGRTLIIIGVILFLIGAGIVVYWLTSAVDDNSIDGCLLSLLMILFYSVIGIGLGITGLVMIILGIVIMSSGQRINDKPQDDNSDTEKA